MTVQWATGFPEWYNVLARI